jgi:toxin ParE1/3/4
MTGRWTVQLSDVAKSDLRRVVDWTADHFGDGQARGYARAFVELLKELATGPDISGCRRRDDIATGLFTVHIARRRRKGRHLLMFRISDGERRHIEVLRILHDAMELRRHLPPDADDEDM